ncbi:MAG: YfgM family protein [Planctomycetota bacterium]|jgi:tetratricopeptide (TPR) repeat protein
MKGERRHELERNELADWLARAFEKIKPYQNAILGGVLLVSVIWVGYAWWYWPSAGSRVMAWDTFHRVSWRLSQGVRTPTESAADFEDIAADYPDTEVALWARVMAADLHLAEGCDTLFYDRALANQQLQEAVEHYLAILGSDSSGPELRQRATFGLARARESQGDLEKAIEHYKEIGKNWPEGAYAGAAASRVEDLNRPATRELYDRFAKFKRQTTSSLGSGQPGERPSFDKDQLKEPGPDEEGTKGDQPPDSPDTPAEPGETKPDGADTEAAGRESSDPNSGDTEAADTESSDTESGDAGATDTGSSDTGVTVPAGTDPDDSAKPPVEKSE